MEYILLFLIGAVLGSFYNVLIYRLPKNISIVSPPSHCPKCGSRIRWFDNIPILSYLLLRGRCRECGARIPIQYPLVELTSGILAALSYYRWGATLDALSFFLFFSALMIASLIDLRFFIIPDIITLPGIALGLASSPFREGITFTESLVGALFGFTIPFAIYIFYVKVRKMEGLGLGDVKLLTMVGSFAGLYGVLSALFLGSLIGLLFAFPSVLRNRNVQFVIPFGPFLSLGCFLGVLFKPQILNLLFGAFPLQS